MTKAIRKAIKRFCEDYDFEDLKELKEYAKDMYGDIVDKYWFSYPDDEEASYQQLQQLTPR